MSTIARAFLPLLALALLVPVTPAGAQASAPATPAAAPAASARPMLLEGAWTGTLRAGPIVATLRLDFAPDSAGRRGSARITPEGGPPALAGDIRDVVIGEREVTFSVPTQEGTMRFTGTPDGAGALAGRLTVVNDRGGIEARGVWSARAGTPAAGR